MINKIIVKKNAKWENASIYKHNKRLFFKKINPLQIAYAKISEEDANVMVEAPTSTGKTLIAVMGIISQGLNKKKISVYVSPLKSLAFEKYKEWSEGIFKDKSILLVSGDQINRDETSRDELINNMLYADIIIITNELFSSLLRRINKSIIFFLKVGVVIVDESHLLGVPVRGSALETAVMKFTDINKNAPLIFLSATLSNSDRVAEWLYMLNNKRTYHIYSEWKYCELEKIFIQYQNSGIIDKRINMIKIIDEIIEDNPNDKYIIFVHSKKTGNEISSHLNIIGYRSVFYNADIDKDIKFEYIEKFKDRSKNGIDILVSTSALAWGINLPARRVIIAGVTRGNEDITIEDITQMCGRAGRMGIDDKGTAYILIPDDKFEYHYKRITTPSPMVSNLYKKNEIMFHLINEISEGCQTGGEIGTWFERSFASFGYNKKVVEYGNKINNFNQNNIEQYENENNDDEEYESHFKILNNNNNNNNENTNLLFNDESGENDYDRNKYKNPTERIKYIADVVMSLIKINACIIKKNEDKIKATFLGKLSSWFYYNPLFITYIFNNIIKADKHIINPIVISWIIGRAYSFNNISHISIKNKYLQDEYIAKLYNIAIQIYIDNEKKDLGLKYINRDTTVVPFLLYLLITNNVHLEENCVAKCQFIIDDNQRFLTMIKTGINLIKMYKIKKYNNLLKYISEKNFYDKIEFNKI